MSVASPEATGPATTQEPLEGVSELGAEDGVDDGVERGVEVAQPQGEGHEVLRERTGAAQRQHEGHREEGRPARHEGSRDDGQRLGRFALPLRVRGVLGLPSDDGTQRRGRQRCLVPYT